MALFGQIEILLVEDEETITGLINTVLQSDKPTPNWPLTYRIQNVDTLRLAKVYAAGGYWDIIILDLSLPDSQGIDTFKAVKEVAKAPIFVFTGSVDQETIEELFQLGAMRVYGKTELMGCMSILHRIIDNCIREMRQRDKLEQLELARLNVLRSLETACSACNRWRTPDTGEWLTPEHYLERYGIYLSHTVCPDDQIKLYGNLREGE